MRSTIGWIAALALVAAASSAQASHGPIDTLATLSSSSGPPVLALDPITGARHMAYSTGVLLQHGWESPGGWQTETIVDSASITSYTTFQMRLAPDGHRVAAYVRKGRLVCAVRDVGGWHRDTLDTLPGPDYPISLALDPTTGEPAVGWARQSSSSSSPSQIFFARHGAGGWTTQLVDTVSSSWLTVALGVDGAHRPHMAWGRPGNVLTYGEGAGPDGPFTTVPVGSSLGLFLLLDMDRSNGEPRLAYYAVNGSGGWEVRYAFRGVGGAWQSMRAFPITAVFPYAPPALALDPAGNPFITYTYITPVEPGKSEPSGTEACGSVNSYDILVYYRAGGAGLGPFSVENLSDPQFLCGSGLSAVASRTTGEAVVGWRSPGFNCPPIALNTSHVVIPSLAGVGGSDDPTVALAPIWPNPARAGDDLRVEFGLPRAAEVSSELHDLAGRLVAARAAAPMTAGRQSIAWSVPSLGPGLYWLTVRSNGVRIGTRSVVILR